MHRIETISYAVSFQGPFRNNSQYLYPTLCIAALRKVGYFTCVLTRKSDDMHPAANPTEKGRFLEMNTKYSYEYLVRVRAALQPGN